MPATALRQDPDIIEPRDAAESAGLVYVGDDSPGIRRKRAGKGFYYLNTNGKRLTDRDTLARIRKLAIPPAYTAVWICPDPAGHIQAVGRDSKGRKQYRYHERFREIRDSAKYDHMLEFARSLPAIRERVSRDMGLRGLPREKVLATVVHLLETTMIRVGNADYAKQNNSFGLTTLRDRHARIDGAELRLKFKGKSGKEWSLRIQDRRIARIIKATQDLPGQHLLQYIDETGNRREVTSTDVNAYLREISGRNVTAKDFRTWFGTVLAALALSEFEEIDSDAAARKNVRAAIETVAARLGNTPTVCRKCYVHPEILDCYMSRELALEVQQDVEDDLAGDLSSLKPEEAAVLALLHRRLARQRRQASSGRGRNDRPGR